MALNLHCLVTNFFDPAFTATLRVEGNPATPHCGQLDLNRAIR